MIISSKIATHCIFTLLLFCFLQLDAFSQDYQEIAKDTGVDLAVINTDSAALKTAPYVNASIITTFNKNTRLVLLNKAETNDYFEVSNIYSLQKGWVHKSLLDTYWTNRKQNCNENKEFTAANALTRCKPPIYLTVSQDEGKDYAIVRENVSAWENILSDKSGIITAGTEAKVVSRTPINDHYLLFDDKTGLRGWVHCSSMQVYFSSSKKTESVFNKTPTYRNEQPKVFVKNQTDRVLTLWVDNTKYTINSGLQVYLPVTAGTHNYIATAPRVNSLVGEELFENGFEYSWVFYIETRRTR